MEENDVKMNYLYGMHPVMEAVLSGRQIEKVVFKQGLEGPQFRELLELLQQKGIAVQFVPAERIDRISKGSHQGVVAYLSRIDYIPLEDMVEMAFAKHSAPLFVLLDGVSDVRNFGAIARTAECAGADGIILPAKGGAAINADAIKTSAGALLRINTHKAQNLRIPIFYLKERGFRIVGATEKASDFMYDIDFTNPTALIMGSEGKGISSSALALCDALAKIPMAGEIGSLNVSAATSIMLYEALRQKNIKKQI